MINKRRETNGVDVLAKGKESLNTASPHHPGCEETDSSLKDDPWRATHHCRRGWALHFCNSGVMALNEGGVLFNASSMLKFLCTGAFAHR